MRRDEYTLNDLVFTPGPVEEIQRSNKPDPDWDEEASLERSRRNREIGETLLRDFRERERAGQLAGA